MEWEIGLLFLAILIFALIIGGLACLILWLNKRRYASKFSGESRVDQSAPDKKLAPVAANTGSDESYSYGMGDIADSGPMSNYIEKSQSIDDAKTDAEDYSRTLARLAAGSLEDFMLPKSPSRKRVLSSKKN